MTIIQELKKQRRILIIILTVIILAVIGSFYPPEDFPRTVNTTIVDMPKIICNNYTIKGGYYYCDIDDIETNKTINESIYFTGVTRPYIEPYISLNCSNTTIKLMYENYTIITTMKKVCDNLK